MKSNSFPVRIPHLWAISTLLLTLLCAPLIVLNDLLPISIAGAFCLGLLFAGCWYGAKQLMLRRRHSNYAHVLTTLSDTQLGMLAAHAERRTFEARTVLFRQHAAADGVYLILHGEVEVLRRDRDGIYAPIGIAGAGSWLGEVGLLGRTTHSIAAKAHTTVEALVLDRAALTLALDTATISPYVASNSDVSALLPLLRDAFQKIECSTALLLLGSPFASLPFNKHRAGSPFLASCPSKLSVQ